MRPQQAGEPRGPPLSPALVRMEGPGLGWLVPSVLGLSSGTLSARVVQGATVLGSLPASRARIPGARALAIALPGAAGCGEN